jgi:hypothetical protein
VSADVLNVRNSAKYEITSSNITIVVWVCLGDLGTASSGLEAKRAFIVVRLKLSSIGSPFSTTNPCLEEHIDR